MAQAAVISASAAVRASSKRAMRRRGRPMAHKGAVCGRRAAPSVNSAVNSAAPATPSVSAFKAEVTVKVRSNIARLSALIAAWSIIWPSLSPNSSTSAAISPGASGEPRPPSRCRQKARRNPASRARRNSAAWIAGSQISEP